MPESAFNDENSTIVPIGHIYCIVYTVCLPPAIYFYCILLVRYPPPGFDPLIVQKWSIIDSRGLYERYLGKSRHSRRGQGDVPGE